MYVSKVTSVGQGAGDSILGCTSVDVTVYGLFAGWAGASVAECRDLYGFRW